MLTFGLTGGIGTGKSTVAAQLRARGIPVLDADLVARDVVAPGSEGLAEIVAAFGPDVLDASGALDRAAMRRRIMTDADARARLEAITHPRIFHGVMDALNALEEDGERIAGVEAALMVETGSYRLYDRLVVVSCAPDTQVARVVARDGVSADEARTVLAAQLPLADKEAVADVVVHNDGDLAALEAQVDALIVRLAADDFDDEE
ncbi:MAG: dephospho-CoA kinase [Alphaproteobacteria bacterium]|nr:dephospho-CoA kinase [Alphaproteobacteria bacterium]